MIPLCGGATGASGKPGPHLEAWYQCQREAEEKRKVLEEEEEERAADGKFTVGFTESSIVTLIATLGSIAAGEKPKHEGRRRWKAIFRPLGHWEAKGEEQQECQGRSRHE